MPATGRAGDVQRQNSGRNRLKFFDPEMQASVLTRVALEQSIHKGLQHGDFFLLYQPQVDRQGRVIGAEALVRWQHPEKGVLGRVISFRWRKIPS